MPSLTPIPVQTRPYQLTINTKAAVFLTEPVIMSLWKWHMMTLKLLSFVLRRQYFFDIKFGMLTYAIYRAKNWVKILLGTL